MIRKSQKSALRRKIAQRKRDKVHKTKVSKRRITNSKFNMLQNTNVVAVDKNGQSSLTSFQKCEQEYMKSSENVDAISQGCVEEKVHEMVDAAAETSIRENAQCKIFVSTMENARDENDRTSGCVNCEEFSSEIQNLKSTLLAVLSDIQNTEKQNSELNKAMEVQKKENDDLTNKLNKQIEEIEMLNNQKTEEEIKVLFLESSILGEHTEEVRTKMLVSKSSNKIAQQNKMIEESTKRLFQMTKKLTKFENQLSNLKRKSKESLQSDQQKSGKNFSQLKTEIDCKLNAEPIEATQGLLVPKPKRLKLEKRKKDDLGQISAPDKRDNEITLLNSHVSELTSRISTFNRCIQNYEELGAEKEVLVKNLNIDLESKNTKLEQYQESNKFLKDENHRLERQILSYSSAIANLNFKIENYASKTNELQRTTENLNISLGSLKKDNDEKNKEIVLFRKKEDMFKLEISKVKEESDYLHEKLIKVRKEMDKYDNIIKSENEQVIQISKLKEKGKIFHARNIKAKEDNDILHLELNKTKEELVKTCNELCKRQEVEESNIEKLMQISEELERRKSETLKMHKELTKLKKENAKTHEKLTQKEKSEESYLNEIIQMKQELVLNEKSLNITKDVIKVREEQLNKQHKYIEQFIKSSFFQKHEQSTILAKINN